MLSPSSFGTVMWMKHKKQNIEMKTFNNDHGVSLDRDDVAVLFTQRFADARSGRPKDASAEMILVKSGVSRAWGFAELWHIRKWAAADL